MAFIFLQLLVQLDFVIFHLRLWLFHGCLNGSSLGEFFVLRSAHCSLVQEVGAQGLAPVLMVSSDVLLMPCILALPSRPLCSNTAFMPAAKGFPCVLLTQSCGFA